MKVISLSGCPAALPSLKYLYSHQHLAAILCPVETAGAETMLLEDWASQREIPCWQVSHQHLEKELTELISEVKPELILVYGFPYTINGELLQEVKHGGWNVHFSLHPNQGASITIHQLASGSRCGRVVNHCSLTLLSSESGISSIEQLSSISVALLQESIRQLHLKKAVRELAN